MSNHVFAISHRVSRVFLVLLCSATLLLPQSFLVPVTYAQTEPETETSAEEALEIVETAVQSVLSWEQPAQQRNTLRVSKPGVPRDLTATPRETSVTLSWRAPSDGGGAPIGEYVVYHYTGVSCNPTWRFGLTHRSARASRSVKVTGLQRDTQYSFNIAARNSVGLGALSACTAVRTTGATPPPASEPQPAVPTPAPESPAPAPAPRPPLAITVTNPNTSPAQQKEVSATDNSDSSEMRRVYVEANTVCGADAFDGNEATYNEGDTITLNHERFNNKKLCFRSVAGDETAYEASATIAGIDTTKPVIALNGEASVALTVGDTYTDAGASVADPGNSTYTGTVTVVGLTDVDTTAAGVYIITYTAPADQAGNIPDPVTRTVTVTRPATRVNDDNLFISEDTPVTIDPLANDVHVAGGLFTIKTQPTNGSIVLLPSNLITYMPNTDFNGIDLFNYSVTVGNTEHYATIHITVMPVNDAPTITQTTVPSPATVGTQYTHSFGVSDPDAGDTHQWSLPQTHGDAAVTNAGVFSWQPIAADGGQTRTFTVSVSDGTKTATHIFSLTVAEVEVPEEETPTTPPAFILLNSETEGLPIVSGDGFGISTALYGGTLAVGAWGDDTTAINAGAVYIFDEQTDGSWVLTATLDNETMEGNPLERINMFGKAVALYGDTLAVGAVWDGISAENLGAVFIFTRQQDGSWTQTMKLDNSTIDGSPLRSQSWFGTSVALHGDTLAVGASGHDDSAGAVYIFTRKNGPWALSTTIYNNAIADNVVDENHLFGTSVALHDTTLAIGAFWDDTGAEDAGAVYIFEKQADGSWTQQTKISDATLGLVLRREDNFGSSVAFDGEILVVGAMKNDTSAQNSGAVYLFEKQRDGSWGIPKEISNITDELTLDQHTLFGSGAAIHGNTIAVGAYGYVVELDPRIGDTYTGAVYLFDKNAAWTMARAGEVREEEVPTPENFAVLDRTSTSITLGWDLPEITNDAITSGFVITYPGHGCSGGSYVIQHKDRWEAGRVATITSLTPNTQYSFQTHTVFDPSTWSLPSNCVNTETLEETPAPAPDTTPPTATVQISTNGANAPHATVDDVITAVVEVSEPLQSTPTFTLAEQEKILTQIEVPLVTRDDSQLSVHHPNFVTRHGNRMALANQREVDIYEYANNRWSLSTALVPDSRQHVSSVALHDNILAVGLGGDDTGGTDKGAVLIYEQQANGAWIRLHKIAHRVGGGPTLPRYSYFGSSVALEDDTLVVGAVFDNTVYIFEKTGNSWAETNVTFIARNTDKGPDSDAVLDSFGSAVAIGGDTIVVGARTDDADRRFSSKGAIYVYEKTGNAWSDWANVTRTKITHNTGGGPDLSREDNFGNAVAVNSDFLVVGADKSGSKDTGAVYIFKKTGSSWADTTVTKIAHNTGGGPALPRNAKFGYSVALDGTKLAVGGKVSHRFGTMHLFDIIPANPTYTTTHTVTENDPQGPVHYTLGQLTDLSGNQTPEQTSIGAVVITTEPSVPDTLTITVTNPDTAPAQSKIVSATDNSDGITTMYFIKIGRSVACDAAAFTTHTPTPYNEGQSVAFTIESDNGKRICFRSVDADGQARYASSTILTGIDATPPTALLHFSDGHDSATLAVGDTITATIGVDEPLRETPTFTLAGEQKRLTNAETTFVLTDESLEDPRLSYIHAVAHQDNTIVFGNRSSVDIYEKENGQWSRQASFIPNNSFISAVALNNDLLAIGTEEYERKGAVYIFERQQDDSWVQRHKIADETGGGPALARHDYFGSSVALDGNTLLVGAEGDDTGGGSKGAVYVFEKTGETWEDTTMTKIADGTNGGPELYYSDYFGSSVALDGNTLVVGARFADAEIEGSDKGAVYVFEKGTSWADTTITKIAHNTNGGPALSNDDNFGNAVALDGDILAVGAHGNDAAKEGPYFGGSNEGAVYVFEKGTSWADTTRTKIVDEIVNKPVLAGHELFGSSLSLDGTKLVVARKPSQWFSGAKLFNVFPTEQTYTATHTITPREIYGPIEWILGRLVDTAGNQELAQRGSNAIVVTDAVAPTLDTPTLAVSPDGRTVLFTFRSSETGAIGYGGPCRGSLTVAWQGPNTITFRDLAPGRYTDCVVTVTDVSGNRSVIQVPHFTIPPVPFAEPVTPTPPTPTAPATPTQTVVETAEEATEEDPVTAAQTATPQSQSAPTQSTPATPTKGTKQDPTTQLASTPAQPTQPQPTPHDINLDFDDSGSYVPLEDGLLLLLHTALGAPATSLTSFTHDNSLETAKQAVARINNLREHPSNPLDLDGSRAYVPLEDGLLLLLHTALGTPATSLTSFTHDNNLDSARTAVGRINDLIGSGG